jgi:hypothetical protein
MVAVKRVGMRCGAAGRAVPSSVISGTGAPESCRVAHALGIQIHPQATLRQPLELGLGQVHLDAHVLEYPERGTVDAMHFPLGEDLDAAM